jgi:hypothetical protein
VVNDHDFFSIAQGVIIPRRRMLWRSGRMCLVVRRKRRMLMRRTKKRMMREITSLRNLPSLELCSHPFNLRFITKVVMPIKQGGKPVHEPASRLYFLCRKGDTANGVFLCVSLFSLCSTVLLIGSFFVSCGRDVFGCCYIYCYNV